jgi:ATP-dependent DNA helicase RecQ
MTLPSIDGARETLRASFGYPDFRPGQAQAVEAVLAGRDTLVVLPTGGGKSLCYQVPALMLPGLTVVVSPLISLMKDQVDALEGRGLPATFINSTLSSGQVSDRLARAQRGEIKLLYVAPERFDAGKTAERLKAMGVSLLAVDEAHCISEWGHDFRPSYLRMKSVRDRLGAPTTIALTATATPMVRRDIAQQLALRDPETIVTGFDRRNLHYHVFPTATDREKDATLIRILELHQGLAVVYASTRKAVEKIAATLERARIRAAAYHAGLDDAHRHEVQDAFMTEQVRAIVATNAFGMGIDKPNVRLVVHYAMPGTLEAYYQEAGRAGRDGLHSECFLLHAFPDRFTHEFFIKGSYPDRTLVERVYEALRRSADSSGRIDRATPDRIAAAAGNKTSPRDVESAMRVLGRAGAVIAQSEQGSNVLVRLLATPERIRRELGAEGGRELGLLRALWRLAGDRLETGALIDVNHLPPGLAGPMTAIPILESLQSRQFVVVERPDSAPRLADPRAPLAAFKIDWAAMDRRRKADLAKLDAMQGYAYARGCRRAFVLRYFGDPAARPKCDGCDNCLGVRHKGATVLAPALASRAAKRRDRTSERAVAVADGEGRRRRGMPDDVAVGPDDAKLFEALKGLRGRIARESKVPAYVVFADRTLAELAVRRPGTLSAFGDIRGVGPAKLEKYGTQFLDLIRRANETEAA